MIIHIFEKQDNGISNSFIVPNGRKTTILKLPGFMQSIVFAKHFSCDNCFIFRINNILNSLGRFRTDFMSDCSNYVQYYKKFKKNQNFIRKALEVLKKYAEFSKNHVRLLLTSVKRCIFQSYINVQLMC